MSAIEHETIINFNAEETEAQIYSCQHYMWNRCEKLGLQAKDIRKDQNGEIISKTYYCPKKWIKIRKPRDISLEQREEMSERFKKVRAGSNFGRKVAKEIPG